MIYKETYLQVADNSGAQQVKCIKILGSSGPSKYASVGDSILVSVIKVKSAKNRSKKIAGSSRMERSQRHSPKKGEIYKAIVIRTKKRRSNLGKFFYGQRIGFQQNYVVLLNQENPFGSRIFGPMSREIRAKKLTKLMSQSQGVL